MTDESQLSSHFVGLCMACAVLFWPGVTDESRLFSHFVGLCIACAMLFWPGVTDESRLFSYFVGLCMACAAFGGRRKPAFFSFRRTMHSLCRLRRPTKANFLLISSDCAWLVPLDGYSRRHHTVRITIIHPSNDQTGQPHLSNVAAPYNFINLSSLHFHPESPSSQALP